MKKILILTPFTFTQRDYKRFGIDILKNFFVIKIIDFSPWFYPNYYKEFCEENLSGNEYFPITKENDFLDLNLKNKNFIIFDLMDATKKAFWVRSKLKNKSNIFLTFDLNPIPEVKIPIKTRVKKYTNFLVQPRLFFSFIFTLLINKLYNMKSNNISDISVHAALRPTILKSKKKLFAHSMDYDIYLKLKKNKSLVSRIPPYAVFIDQDLVTHPDLKIFNYDSPVSEKKYFASLLNFFKNFKIKTGLDIKFAVHPKSRNKKLKDLLQGVDFSLGKTAELIKNSSLVMLHSSTALSFAILFKKPTIFITTDELKKSWLGPRIKNFSKQVGRKPVNIDEDLGQQLNLKEVFNLDKEKYSKYINQYLKAPNSPDIPLWEIVCNFLKNKYKY